jgi:hypothetical protein
MASNYQSALGIVRAALIAKIKDVNSAWVTSSAITFPRVEVGDLSEMRTTDKGYSVRMLYCNIDVISKSYSDSLSIKGQIDAVLIGLNTLSMTGFKSVSIESDNVSEIIEPQEGSFTIYRIITRIEITVESEM